MTFCPDNFRYRTNPLLRHAGEGARRADEGRFRPSPQPLSRMRERGCWPQAMEGDIQ
jgi:hypothetical protein